MAIEVERAPKQISIILRDPQAIEIVEKISPENFNEIIEKYIILGDLVLRYASIVPARKSIMELLPQDLPDVLKELKSKAETLGRVENKISKFLDNWGIPGVKGRISAEAIYKDLEFSGDKIEDVSSVGKYADIKATLTDLDEQVLIEVKDWESDVETKEVEKFWGDMDYRRCSYGIFISMRTRIAKITDDIKIVPKGDKTAIFLVNEKLGWRGHRLAYYVIRKLAEAKREIVGRVERDKLAQALEKLNTNLKEIKNEMQVASEIEDIAKELQEYSRKKLTDIMTKASNLRTRIDTIVECAFKEVAS